MIYSKLAHLHHQADTLFFDKNDRQMDLKKE